MIPGRIPATQVAEYAARQVAVKGTCRPADLPRLAATITSGALLAGADRASDRIEVECEFCHGVEGFPEIALRMQGDLHLVCQRCLQAMHWPVAGAVRLAVVPSERDLEQLVDPFDSTVMSDGELDLAAVIEDEILAALPLAPVHGPGEQCAAAIGHRASAAAEAAEVARPFAGLRELIGRDGTGNSGR